LLHLLAQKATTSFVREGSRRHCLLGAASKHRGLERDLRSAGGRGRASQAFSLAMLFLPAEAREGEERGWRVEAEG
jgi:hypothetical protein